MEFDVTGIWRVRYEWNVEFFLNNKVTNVERSVYNDKFGFYHCSVS